MKARARKTVMPYVNNSYVAEPLEIELARLFENNEPISATAPLNYSDEYDAATDIRTDKWDLVMTVADAVEKYKIVKSDGLAAGKDGNVDHEEKVL